MKVEGRAQVLYIPMRASAKDGFTTVKGWDYIDYVLAFKLRPEVTKRTRSFHGRVIHIFFKLINGEILIVTYGKELGIGQEAGMID